MLNAVLKLPLPRATGVGTTEETKPPTLLVGEMRPTPRLPSPWTPTMPGLAPGLMLLPSGRLVLLKLKPGWANVTVPVVGSRLLAVAPIGAWKPALGNRPRW